jgi:phospholipid transport system substrate-binding protein
MQVIKRFLGLFTVLFLLASTAAIAAPGPLDQARATVDAVMAILKDSNLEKQVRRERLTAAIRARFDFAEMSQRILALNWKKANATQRERFVTLFSSLLERNYIGRIEAYTDEKIDFVKERVQGNRAAVDTLIITKSVEIPISYRMVQEGDEWMVYDVVIESVSFVNNYRSSYGEILKKDGFDGLLVQMSKKLTELEQQNGSPTEP